MLRFLSNAARVFLAALLLVTSTAFASNIIRWKVVTEASHELLLEVEYSYSGEFGENVFLFAEAASYGKAREGFYYRPAKVLRGVHVAQVALGTNGTSASTDQLRLGMYVANSYKIVDELVLLKKAWRNPADLAVIDLTLNPTQPVHGQPVTVLVTVANKGGTSTGAFDVAWWPGESYPNSLTRSVSGLAPGEQTTVVFTYTGYPSWYAKLVTRVVVDPNRTALDVNMTNNELRREIEVRRK